jgi:hypothetical protein
MAADLKFKRGRTIDHIEVVVHGETHPWKAYIHRRILLMFAYLEVPVVFG